MKMKTKFKATKLDVALVALIVVAMLLALSMAALCATSSPILYGGIVIGLLGSHVCAMWLGVILTYWD